MKSIFLPPLGVRQRDEQGEVAGERKAQGCASLGVGTCTCSESKRRRVRDSHLEKVPGFAEFHLLKGPRRPKQALGKLRRHFPAPCSQPGVNEH
jgi:hypothetical protein